MESEERSPTTRKRRAYRPTIDVTSLSHLVWQSTRSDGLSWGLPRLWLTP